MDGVETVRGRRFVEAIALVEGFRAAPRVDRRHARSDLDVAVDQAVERNGRAAAEGDSSTRPS